jgi:CheY-like chemotaxis protein
MRDEVLQRAFEPFFTTKDVRQGTGLGLSLVHGFATQSGGGALIESRRGEGTNVTLFLPRADSAAPTLHAVDTAAPPPPAPAAVPHAPTNILVVEDDPDLRILAATLLKDMGYDCVAAENGVHALGLLEAHDDIALLFTDIVMPGGMNGYALWEEAARRRPALRVVFTSGNADGVYGRDQSDGHFLRKPYERIALRDIIASALAGRR